MLQKIINTFTQKRAVESFNTHALSLAWRTTLPWTKVEGGICFAGNWPYLETALANRNIVGIIIPPALLSNLILDQTDKLILVTEDAEELFYTIHLAQMHNVLNKAKVVTRFIAPTAQIHPTAILDERVHISHNVTIEAYAIIRNDTVIADNCWIGSHAILGDAAFFPRTFQGEKMHIPHFGGVRLGKNCRIFAQVTIAASSYFSEFTELADNVHLGFKTCIGHDSYIGENTSASTNALIAGRCTIGKNVWIGASACISNTLIVGDGASIKIGSVVIDNVPAAQEVSGNFAINHQKNILRKIKGF